MNILQYSFCSLHIFGSLSFFVVCFLIFFCCHNVAMNTAVRVSYGHLRTSLGVMMLSHQCVYIQLTSQSGPLSAL